MDVELDHFASLVSENGSLEATVRINDNQISMIVAQNGFLEARVRIKVAQIAAPERDPAADRILAASSCGRHACTRASVRCP